MFFPLYEKHLNNPHIIFTRRKKSQIQESILKKHGKGYPQSEKMVLNFRKMKKYIKERHQWIEIDFEKALADPRETVKKIAEFIGVEPNEEAINFIDKKICD